MYGLTTGFGALADVRIPAEDLERLQRNLVRSHAAGAGELLPAEIVRAMMLLRARALAAGSSGVRPVLVERLVDLLNARITPAVPSRGSVGASGDLAQLAHIALCLIGEGSVLTEDGGRQPTAVALRRAGIEPVTLAAKEGLALVNGTDGMLAIGTLAAHDITGLLRTADVAAAMSIEGALGTDRPFAREIVALRPQPGQADSAFNLRALLAESAIIASHRDSPHAVQDPYSMRCAPQVHGATRDAAGFAADVFERERDSIVDNPVILSDGRVESTGNFHGEPLALRARPPGHRAHRPGEHQRATNLLAAGPRRAARPASVPVHRCRARLRVHARPVHPGPAGLGEQGPGAPRIRRLDPDVRNPGGPRQHGVVGGPASSAASWSTWGRSWGSRAMCAAQALDLRAPLEPGRGTGAARTAIRTLVPFLAEDRELAPDIEAVTTLVRNAALVDAALEAVGDLR